MPISRQARRIRSAISPRFAIRTRRIGRAPAAVPSFRDSRARALIVTFDFRSEEHTSELQSLAYLVCRLLLEKKKKNVLATEERVRDDMSRGRGVEVTASR